MIEHSGTIIRSYKGKGKIVFGEDYNVTIEIIQVADGSIYMECKADRFVPINNFSTTVKVIGETYDGREIIAEGFVYNTKIESPMRIQLLLSNVQIGESTKEVSNASVIFKITNLKIDRNYSLNIEGYSIDINCENNYSDIIKSLKISRSIEVTCNFIFKEVQINELDSIIRVAGNLCALLTLAKGCYINWIYYDVFCGDNHIISNHANRITKKYGVFQLIASNPTKDLENYLYETYNNFLRIKEIIEIEKTIAEYTDAKLETDYLEFRALKQTITLEQIKSNFLTITNKEHIIDNDIFNKKACLLKNNIKDTLKELFIDEDPTKIELMTNHITGLNYYPLRRALMDMCKYFKIKISKKDIDRFINIRNDLVHRLKFNNKYGESWDQYCFLMTFVGKILLSVLGYTSYYYDWTKHKNYEYEGRVLISG